MTKYLATLFLMAALLAPFASGWAMALGLGDGRLMVICSGDGLRTIYIDENGDATQVSDEVINCVLKSAADTSTPIRPERSADQLLFVTKTHNHHELGQSGYAFFTPHPRAPPLI
ncbi:MAG: hypothetical protein AAFO72_03265 [Pseudomonadota bacterium]